MEYESLIDNNSDNLGKMNDSFEPSQKELPTPPLHPKDPKDSLVIPPFPPADLGLSPVNEETEEQLFTDIVSIEPTISAPELHPQPIMVAPKKLIALPQPSSQPASPPLNSSLSTPVPARPPPLTETKSRPPSEHRYSHSSTSFDSQPSTKSGKSIKSRLQTALQKASRVAAKDVPNETPKKSLITRAASKSSKRFSKLADIPLPTPKPPVETKDLPKKTGNRFTKLFRKKQ
ncbi:hypothetical protein CLU79DRAFT_762472 [Phycomyces nitens]|nr:hypothetical protein CLU79DRAFT_762472 [Phycomyces nitens]